MDELSQKWVWHAKKCNMLMHASTTPLHKSRSSPGLDYKLKMRRTAGWDSDLLVPNGSVPRMGSPRPDTNLLLHVSVACS